MLHLCQPDNQKSCGACCGLYNWHDHTRPTLTALLRQRSALFLALGDGPDLEEYSRMARGLAQGPRLLEEIYNCEFLGFLDDGERRVGCLLHPSLHHGSDLRERSFYGAGLCASHLCPSYTHLTELERLAAVKASEDWYIYGLVITDIDFVKEFLRHAQDTLGDALRPVYLEDPEVLSALRDYFCLKEKWEFSSSEPRLGMYYFTQSEYRLARIEYEKRWRIKPSRFDRILMSLSSEFETERQVRQAEDMIEERIRRFVWACKEAGRGMASKEQGGG